MALQRSVILPGLFEEGDRPLECCAMKVSLQFIATYTINVHLPQANKNEVKKSAEVS